MKKLCIYLLAFTSLSANAFSRQTFLRPINCQSKVKVAFFDADSTLRISKSGSVSANSSDDVLVLPTISEELKKKSEEGYLIAVVSNQGGVEHGHVSLKVAEEALSYMVKLIEIEAGVVHYFDFAEARDEFRKPQIGMAVRLQENLNAHCGFPLAIDKENSFMVGDSAYKKTDSKPNGLPGYDFSNSDRLFAENFGIKFYPAMEFFPIFYKLLDAFRDYSTLKAE